VTKEGFDLPRQVRTIMALDPSAPALQFADRWFTWSDLSGAVDRIDELLTSAGIGTGSAVGIVLRNSPEAVAALLAVISTGRTVLSLSPIQPQAALRADVEALRPPTVIASRSDWSPELRDGVRSVQAIGISLEVGDHAQAEYVEGCEELGTGDFYPSDHRTAVVMLTSGTTGPSKRVRLSYASLETSLTGVAHYQSRDPIKPALKETTVVQWSPLVHISGLWSVLSSVVEGRKISLMERFDVSGWASRMEEHRPKTASLPPTAMRMVLDANVPKAALASLRAVRSGTAPLDPAVKREFESRYGVPVLIVYGATEFAGALAGWTLRDHERYSQEKNGSVGRPHPGIDVRVVDAETGQVLPAGTTGILEAKSPQLPSPGWVRTTDLARIDEDGFIWLAGRADDVIIRGGFKVPTAGVAGVLREHPAVLDAAVIGLPDARLGAVPVAAVELRPGGGGATPDELLAMLRGRLPPYQVPVRILIVDTLPRTPSMKISQPGVAAMFAA
jgi:long-chain acyl-CoA synthetase